MPILTPLRIGPLTIDFPVVQAALSGYSDWPMRVIARRLGAGYTLGEVLLDAFILNVTKGRKAKRFIRVTDDERPCGAQLMGAEPEQFAPAAIKLLEAGFDAVDLNFGCPVKKVLGRCRGGYLLSQPQTALEIVARVREATPPAVPVTVKMRRGMDDSPESLENFYTIFDGAFALGVAAITVHGRTVRQRYEGPSSWSFLREVKRHAGDRVVLGSGDLFSAEDCLRMMSETGVDGVTVARGAIGNPWIFREARALWANLPLPPPPSLAEQRAVMEEHYALAEEAYGSRRSVGPMKKFGIKYSRLHPEEGQVRAAFFAARDAEEWRQVLRRWYGGERT
ncbi:MAG: tRNA-dihydrouridine synthase family protein [Rhodopirellula sp.]|nr:tRNA-dihydrouridine synthase family protein [Rhodopirellula sp.]